MSQYYNLYYINYQKAFEISMLIDNNIIHSIEKTANTNVSGEGKLDANTSTLSSLPLIGKYTPQLSMAGGGNISKSSSTLDNINVVSTKSTILRPLLEKAQSVRTLNQKKIGDLVKLQNLELKIENNNDILSTKTLLSGLINHIPVDGLGELDISKLFQVFLKDTSYIISGKKK